MKCGIFQAETMEAPVLKNLANRGAAQLFGIGLLKNNATGTKKANDEREVFGKAFFEVANLLVGKFIATGILIDELSDPG